MRLLRQRVIATIAGVKSREWSATVICGEDTAEKLGVPIGTEIDLGRVAYWHRNPFKQWRARKTVSGGFDPWSETFSLDNVRAVRFPA